MPSMMSFDINDGLYCTMVLSVVNLLDTQDCTSLFLSYKALDLIVTRQGPKHKRNLRPFGFGFAHILLVCKILPYP